jgi:hypothetical protein
VKLVKLMLVVNYAYCACWTLGAAGAAASGALPEPGPRGFPAGRLRSSPPACCRAYQSMVWKRHAAAQPDRWALKRAWRHDVAGLSRSQAVLRAAALGPPTVLAGTYAVTVRPTVAVIAVLNSEIAALQGQPMKSLTCRCTGAMNNLFREY